MDRVQRERLHRRLSSRGFRYFGLALCLAAIGCASPAMAATYSVLTGDGDFNAQTIGSPVGAPNWSHTSGTGNSVEPEAQSSFTNLYANNGKGVNVPGADTSANPYFVGYTSSIGTTSKDVLYFNADFQNTSTGAGAYTMVITNGAQGQERSVALYVTGDTLYAESLGGKQAVITSLSQNQWYNVRLALDMSNKTFSGVATQYGGASTIISDRTFYQSDKTINCIYTDTGSSGPVGLTGTFASHNIDNFTLGQVAGGPAPKNLINIDFNGARNGDELGPTFVGTAYSGGGLVWNGITADSRGTTDNDMLTVSGSELLNSAGTKTSVNLSVANVGGDVGGTPTTDATLGSALWSDYIFCNSAGNQGQNPQFTISGLGSATAVDLYFYVSGNGAGISAGSVTGTYIDANILFFDNVAVTNGTITGNLSNNGLCTVVEGLSIVSVPEPGMFALLAAGLIGLLAYAWRKRK